MKRYKNLYPQIYPFANLYQAFRAARKGKREQVEAASFEFDLEHNLLELETELHDQSYRPGGYTSFFIYEPKRRLVSAAPFRDRVVHHALCRVIEPIWEARFISTSFACRVGKGTHKALDQAHAWVRQYLYAFQGDIVKYFPSIDHQILRSLLAHHIADRQTMGLIDVILESGAGLLADEYPMTYFPGDDLFAVTRPRGLPIGVRRESVLYDCSAQKCVSNLLFHQQYPKRCCGKVTNRIKPANNVSRTRKSAARTVRRRQVCQRQGG